MLRTYSRKRSERCSGLSRTPLGELKGNRLNESVKRVNIKLKSLSKVSKSSKSSKGGQDQIQLVFGTQSQQTCSQCLMSYVPISPSDVALHLKFHQRSLEGREWTEGRENKVFIQSNSDYVVKVDASSCVAHKRAVEDVLSLANTELSAPDENPTWKTIAGKGAAFVYIKSKRAVAVVVVERISKGRYMNASTGQLASKTVPLTVGVSRVYCARKHRRSGLATILLDASCKEFIYGLHVPKYQVGWSQPSASGAKLASGWNGVSDTATTVRYVMTYLESECI